ncbi:MAG: 3-deoxy-7-phosphoheptulonate synthase, partial [Planctomycetes bacterium]|nr:3-deoxy-7-phosphoheptulonate synthase [Planctomycetota bacterium]
MNIEDLPGLSVTRRGCPEYAAEGAVREVAVRGVVVGGGRPVVIAGPCAVETREQTLRVARAVKAAGGDMLRGGAFKPRTNPHSFQGLGQAGLEILAEARAETGLPIVTEVMDPRLVERVGEVADVLQVGSRNMQNFPLLVEVGRFGKPVLLKRGFAATLEEWLCAAEYVAMEGNRDILLCERGIRTFTQGEYGRNTLDLNVVPALREVCWLPVVVDPSHATGDYRRVPAASAAAIASGADGLIIEVLGDEAERCRTL